MILTCPGNHNSWHGNNVTLDLYRFSFLLTAWLSLRCWHGNRVQVLKTVAPAAVARWHSLRQLIMVHRHVFGGGRTTGSPQLIPAAASSVWIYSLFRGAEAAAAAERSPADHKGQTHLPAAALFSPGLPLGSGPRLGLKPTCRWSPPWASAAAERDDIHKTTMAGIFIRGGPRFNPT